MNNKLQNDEYYLPGGLGEVIIAHSGNKAEISNAFFAKDGSVTLIIAPNNPCNTQMKHLCHLENIKAHP